MFNPDKINVFSYDGNAHLLYLEAQKDRAHIRFTTNPRIDGPTDTEFLAQSATSESFILVVILFECNKE
jgi:hypothetical protein